MFCFYAKSISTLIGNVPELSGSEVLINPAAATAVSMQLVLVVSMEMSIEASREVSIDDPRLLDSKAPMSRPWFSVARRGAPVRLSSACWCGRVERAVTVPSEVIVGEEKDKEGGRAGKGEGRGGGGEGARRAGGRNMEYRQHIIGDLVTMTAPVQIQ